MKAENFNQFLALERSRLRRLETLKFWALFACGVGISLMFATFGFVIARLLT